MVRTVVDQEHVSLLCLQETKVSVIDDQFVRDLLGGSFDYHYLPAHNTRGGILMAWRTNIWSGSNFTRENNSITVKLMQLADGFATWVTTVYGPQADTDKINFLDELRSIRQRHIGPWLLCGDFNMIYNASDKNNAMLHRRMMGRFRKFLNDLELRELHLHGRLYTWSNERAHPTLERIDRVFTSLDWNDRFPNCHLRQLSADASDHAPLLIHTNVQPISNRRFRFEALWPRLPGYLETVAAAWQPTLRDADRMRILDFKLRNTARALQSWSQRFVGSVRLQLAIAREVVLRLEMVQDTRQLSQQELELRRELKYKTLGLSSMERTIARQRSHIHYLAEGDANTKFFQLQACHRNRKSFVYNILHQGTVLAQENEKQEAVDTYYDEILGTQHPRTAKLNFSYLGIPSLDLTSTDACFSEDEIWSTIRDMPSDRSPGLTASQDYFTRLHGRLSKMISSTLSTRCGHLMAGVCTY